MFRVIYWIFCFASSLSALWRNLHFKVDFIRDVKHELNWLLFFFTILFFFFFLLLLFRYLCCCLVVVYFFLICFLLSVSVRSGKTLFYLLLKSRTSFSLWVITIHFTSVHFTYPSLHISLILFHVLDVFSQILGHTHTDTHTAQTRTQLFCTI